MQGASVFNAMVGRSYVSGGYFRAMGVQVLSGREFTARDDMRSERVAVVNRSMARRFWPDGDPVGARVARGRIPGDWLTVVGVVGVVEDVVRRDIIEPREPMLYVPVAQIDNPYELGHMQYVVLASSPRSVVPAMRAAVRGADADLPVGSITTMDDDVVASIGDRLFEMRILAIFAVLALLLAAVGIYGVTAYAVSERTAEIGVRRALGAGGVQVAGMMLRCVLLLAVSGLLLGSLGGWLATRLIETSLYGVGPNDPMTFFGVILLLASVSAAAGLVPTRRAMRVSPSEVLKW